MKKQPKTIQDQLTAMERIKLPTPKFFKILRRIGMVIGGIGAAIIAAPVALPAALTAAAGYLITVGAVAASVSTLTVDFTDELPDETTPTPKRK